MALQLNYTTRMGFTAPEAYARIKAFTGTKTGVTVAVEFFYDAAAKTALPVGTGTYSLTLPNGATMTQMYDALKVLPAFTEASDA